MNMATDFVRIFVVGRHELTYKQEFLLSQAVGGRRYFFVRAKHIDSVDDIIRQAREVEAEIILILALPLRMLEELLARAKDGKIDNIEIWKFETVSLGLFRSKVEAYEAGAEEANYDEKTKTWRGIKTKRLLRLKRLIFESDIIAEAGE